MITVSSRLLFRGAHRLSFHADVTNCATIMVLLPQFVMVRTAFPEL